jgi:ribosome-associated protein
MRKVTLANIESELIINTSRSSGSGGQNVNKVETKVEIRINIGKSNFFNEDEKALILEKLKTKINQETELIVVSQESRSQLKNKTIAIKKLLDTINGVFIKKKTRKPTQPTIEVIESRLKKKKSLSDKKNMRKKVEF